jgi:hypothetical protein
LIALNNLEQGLSTNGKLRLESSWFVVPLVYATGQRVQIRLEKGALGNKVFRDAFEYWKSAGISNPSVGRPPSQRGGKAMAIAFTLVETAKLNGIEPQA